MKINGKGLEFYTVGADNNLIKLNELGVYIDQVNKKGIPKRHFC